MRRLDDRLRELRVTVVEDRPSRNDGVVPDNLELAVEDLLGWLQEASDSRGTPRTRRPSIQSIWMARGGRSARARSAFERMEQVFSSNLVSYEQLADLTSFGKRAPGRVAYVGAHGKAWNRSVPCAHG